MKFDMHVHSELSYDSSMTDDEIIAAAKEKGLSGVAICDHNRFKARESRDGVYIINGCEYSTDAGHLLVFFQKEPINESLSRDERGRFFWRDICEFAHRNGALVFLAHPFAPYFERSDVLFEKIDGIEVFNSRIVHSKKIHANADALELWQKTEKAYSAGSDAHTVSEIGTSYLEFDLDGADMTSPDFEEKLKAAIFSKTAKVFAGAAPRRDVMRAKRSAYKSIKFRKKQLRTYFSFGLVLKKRLHGYKFTPGYLDLKKGN